VTVNVKRGKMPNLRVRRAACGGIARRGESSGVRGAEGLAVGKDSNLLAV
jgi:hypothetical protein